MAGRIPEPFERPAWYLHRLRSMPPEELPFRVAEQVQRTLGRRAPRARQRPVGRRTSTGLADLVLQWSRHPHVVRLWAEQAAAVSRGEVMVFGRPWGSTAEGLPDWDLDPLTGYRWPQDYCFDVPLVPPTDQPVEVKYVWELNRLLHLLPVAAHAAFENDVETARLCRLHLEDWVRAHPPHRGVHWRSGIELAIRVMAFVLVLELTTRDLEADTALEALVGRAVADHAEWIRRFPSRYSSANNHRVAELAGLLIAASAYPELAHSDDVERWWSELEALVLLQFHADGVPAEQATMYGFLVLEWLSVCLHLARRQKRELREPTRQRIQSAARFLASVTDVRGNAVRFGDDDDSRLLTAARPHEELPRTVLELVAQGLGVPVPLPEPGLSTFADGGYTVWRSGTDADELLLVLDHGPLGMRHLAAHAHADTLAVYLHVGGRPVIVDAGTYLYHSVGDWRDRLRRTAEHNTVVVAAEDSSLMVGPFSWRRGHRAAGRLVSVWSTDTGWFVEAEHHGYARRHGVVHRRTVEGLGSRSLRLTDHLGGRGAGVAFRWSFLLAPGLDVVPSPEGWLLRSGGTDLLELRLPPEWRPSAREEPAWHSPAFGRLEPACRLLVEGRVVAHTSIQVGINAPTSPEHVRSGSVEAT